MRFFIKDWIALLVITFGLVISKPVFHIYKWIIMSVMLISIGSFDWFWHLRTHRFFKAPHKFSFFFLGWTNNVPLRLRESTRSMCGPSTLRARHRDVIITLGDFVFCILFLPPIYENLIFFSLLLRRNIWIYYEPPCFCRLVQNLRHSK